MGDRNRIWDRIERVLAAYERRAIEANAATVTFRTTANNMLLSIRFKDGHHSNLYVDLDRKSWTMCIGFGARQSVSDYELRPSWLLALCRAVTKGAWQEDDCWIWFFRVSTTARLKIAGRFHTFTDGFPGRFERRVLGARITNVVVYDPWHVPSVAVRPEL